MRPCGVRVGQEPGADQVREVGVPDTEDRRCRVPRVELAGGGGTCRFPAVREPLEGEAAVQRVAFVGALLCQVLRVETVPAIAAFAARATDHQGGN